VEPVVVMEFRFPQHLVVEEQVEEMVLIKLVELVEQI
jgi:hypothetical protein|tara:strand:- start:3 stop:113 length:111 start_codon:yes stop_codon:yes gene_type:complete